MARVIGHDKKVCKRITCRHCSAVVEYLPKDVRTKSYFIQGDPSGHKEVTCPECKTAIEILGTSW